MMKLETLLLAAFVLLCAIDRTNAQLCIEEIETIYEQELMVTDTSVRRTYILCPRRIFIIGTLDFNYELQGFRVHPPLPIRPNINIKCGDDGSRENLCWLAEGDIQMDATEFRGITDATVDNVLIEGIVFLDARRYSLWATKPGHITFRDCEFKDMTKSVVPLLLDWYDGTDSQLTVTIADSYFHNNRYFGMGSNTALIYANSNQNTLDIRRTTFEQNDMIHNNTMATTNSFIIETLGPLIADDLCFIDNTIGVSNAVVFGNQLISDNIFVSNSTGRFCGFGSVFETLRQFDLFAPVCVSALASRCGAIPVGPTVPPTNNPTMQATPAPTLSPTAAPTLSGSPTTAPSPAPSPAPSLPGVTAVPTAAPTRLPTSPPVTAGPTSAPATSTPTGVDSTKRPTPAPTDDGTRPPAIFVFPTTEPSGQGSESEGRSLVAGLGLVWMVVPLILL